MSRPKRDRQAVTVVVRKRFEIYGRGYNSEVEAYMQIAKWEVRNECDAECRKALANFGPLNTMTDVVRAYRHDLIYSWDKRWYANRYPVREGCNCAFCARGGKDSTIAGIPSGRGCWQSRLTDYRRRARIIMSEIKLGLRDSHGTKILALPTRLLTDAQENIMLHALGSSAQRTIELVGLGWRNHYTAPWGDPDVRRLQDLEFMTSIRLLNGGCDKVTAVTPKGIDYLRTKGYKVMN